MDYNDLNIIDFSKAPKDLINFIETCPSIYYTLLPYSETPGFVKSKNGGYVSIKFIKSFGALLKSIIFKSL